MMMVAMLAVANCEMFRREFVGPNRIPVVGVYDNQGKSMYGVMLGPEETYEQYIMRQRFGLLRNSCVNEAQDKDMNMLGIE